VQTHLSIWDRLVTKLSYTTWLGFLARRFQRKDDFEWSTYTRSYVETDPDYTQLLSTVRYSVSGNRIILPPEALPLHHNHRLIYETTLQLGVASAFEFGFGGGYHLANLRSLLPDAALGGVDVSEQQRTFAMRVCGPVFNDPRSPIWNDVRDMTVDGAGMGLEALAELVYCQAVLMHIHGGGRPKSFLRNMWKVSSRYVLLVENWRRHDFVRLLREVFPGNTLYLVHNESQRGILLDKLNSSGYPVVQSDNEMRAAERPPAGR
jgi:hypothetical protein